VWGFCVWVVSVFLFKTETITEKEKRKAKSHHKKTRKKDGCVECAA